MATLGLLVSEILLDVRTSKVTHATFFSIHAEIPREFSLLAQAIDVLSTNKADIYVGKCNLTHFDLWHLQRLVGECKYLLDRYIFDYRNEVTIGNASWTLPILDFTYKRRAIGLLDRICGEWLPPSVFKSMGSKTHTSSTHAVFQQDFRAAPADEIISNPKSVVRVQLPSKVIELDRLPVVKDSAIGREITIPDAEGRIIFRHQIITPSNGACYPYTPYKWNCTDLPVVSFRSKAIANHVVELEGQILHKGAESPQYSFFSHQFRNKFQQEVRGKDLVDTFEFVCITSGDHCLSQSQNIKIWRDRRTLELSMSFFSNYLSFWSDFEFQFTLLDGNSAIKRRRGVDVLLAETVISNVVQVPFDNEATFDLNRFRIIFPDADVTFRFWRVWESCWKEHESRRQKNDLVSRPGEVEDELWSGAHSLIPSELEAKPKPSSVVHQTSASYLNPYQLASRINDVQELPNISLSGPETLPFIRGNSSRPLPNSEESDHEWPSNDASWVIVNYGADHSLHPGDNEFQTLELDELQSPGSGIVHH